MALLSLGHHRVAGVEVEVRVLVQGPPTRDRLAGPDVLDLGGGDRRVLDLLGQHVREDPALEDRGQVHDQGDEVELGELVSFLLLGSREAWRVAGAAMRRNGSRRASRRSRDRVSPRCRAAHERVIMERLWSRAGATGGNR
jgi:hypothetical protein